MLDVVDQPCAVVGGGPVGADRAETLREYGARVKVISPDILPRIEELLVSGAIEEHVQRRFVPADVDGCRMVIAATDNPEVNAQVLAACDASSVLCNVAGAGTRGHVQLPASVSRGPLAITVSTSGTSPRLARLLRERLADTFSPEWGDLVELIGELRPEIEAAPVEHRDEMIDAAIDGIARAMLAGGADREVVREHLRQELQA